VPPQAFGAMMNGSTSANAGIFNVVVADTNFDRVYEARYARLAAEFEQGPASFSVTQRRPDGWRD
jgi:hypothetical protein